MAYSLPLPGKVTPQSLGVMLETQCGGFAAMTLRLTVAAGDEQVPSLTLKVNESGPR